MTNFYDAFDVRPFTLWLDVQVTSQSIELNRSYVSWTLRIRKDGNSTPFNNTASPWSVTIAGQNWKGNYAYNMSQAVGSSVEVASGGRMVYHNANGTMAIGVESYFNDTAGQLDYAFLSGSMSLPTIPRASTPSFSDNSVEFGTPVTINTNRASTSFTHTIKYVFGAQSGTIATGVTASHVWTPPLSLLNEIPSATSAYVGITLETYNGASLVGSKTVTTLQLVAAADIVPDFTTVTHSEAVSGVAANVGAYVQNVSKLALAITGAVGAYGSTITAYQISVGQQTINSVSGTTPNPLTGSGTVVLTGKVTDSRGRTATKTVNLTVLPYSPPAVTAFTVQRATAGGVLDPEGTSLRVDLNAAASSLLNTTERNDLKLVTKHRLRGTTVWSAPINSDPAGLSYNSFYVLPGTFGVEDAWEVRVEVVDDFNVVPLQSTVSVAEVFMHWGPGGVGIGKFHENGRLDVSGDGHFSGKVDAGTTLRAGAATAANVLIENNKITALNNGADASLSINATGGNVTVGDATTVLSVPGQIDTPYLPYRSAAGRIAVAASGITTVNLPAGRFTQAPRVVAQVISTTGSVVGVVWIGTDPTTTSFSARIFTLAGAQVAGVIEWHAMQMTSTGASG